MAACWNEATPGHNLSGEQAAPALPSYLSFDHVGALWTWLPTAAALFRSC